jgi:hypothetical protein
MNLEKSIKNFFEQSNPLNSTSTLQVLSRIEKYKNIDLKRISDKELFNLTLETIPCCNVRSIVLQKGTRLYRLRKLEDGKAFENVKELIYPPAKYVKVRGRFNEKKESILYASLDETTPFFEVKAEDGEEYALIEYEIQSEEGIQVTIIAMDDTSGLEGLNEVGKVNHKILEQFLYTEFTKDVGKGTEHLYRISTMLAKNFLDIPNCEGYLYPSVAFGRQHNIAIKPFAVDNKIKVVGVKNIRLTEISDMGEVKGEIISYSVNISENKIIYDVG